MAEGLPQGADTLQSDQPAAAMTPVQEIILSVWEDLQQLDSLVIERTRLVEQARTLASHDMSTLSKRLDCISLKGAEATLSHALQKYIALSEDMMRGKEKLNELLSRLQVGRRHCYCPFISLTIPPGGHQTSKPSLSRAARSDPACQERCDEIRSLEGYCDQYRKTLRAFDLRKMVSLV